MVDAIEQEIRTQRHYLGNDKIRTIYFGGGTPSLLLEKELSKLLDSIHNNFDVASDIEITLEANPDDLSKAKIISLKNMGINRLSIGVQSFFNEDLEWMNRSHNVDQAIQCIRDAQSIGITNITIDLIFGSPTSTPTMWQQNLEKANQLEIPHLSCYGLTVEPDTALSTMIKKGKTIAPKEEDYADQFVTTMEQLTSMGYDHYEISNYAKDNKISQHNTNYWKQKNYLGIGPGAHSFNGHSRQWNISHNAKYISGINEGESTFEIEKLKEKDIYNEYLMTGLRTKWGCNKNTFFNLSDKVKKAQEFLLASYISNGEMVESSESIKLTTKGKLMADNIISSFFINEL